MKRNVTCRSDEEEREDEWDEHMAESEAEEDEEAGDMIMNQDWGDLRISAFYARDMLHGVLLFDITQSKVLIVVKIW